MSTANKWMLKIQLDGEWEECNFSTCKEALISFAALSQDYRLKLKRAVLLTPALNRFFAEASAGKTPQMQPRTIN